MEGSTGKGNDQYRMHNMFKLFAPQLEVLCLRPRLRPHAEGRRGALRRVGRAGQGAAHGRRRQDDVVPLHRLGRHRPQPGAARRHLACGSSRRGRRSDKGETITLRYVEGIPVELNGKKLPLDELIAELNVIAGRNGVGYIDMFEDGIMDLKSREIYEAPAAHVILKLHRDLEQQCLTKEEIQFKKMVDAKWAYMTYHGEWYHPLKADLDAFIAPVAEAPSTARTRWTSTRATS